MASESLVKRLEAAVAAVEALVPKIGSRVRGGGSGGGDDDEEEVPEYVLEWQALTAGKGGELTAALGNIELPQAKEAVETAFNNITNMLKANAACKKPKPQEAMELLKGLSEAVATVDKLAFKRPKRGKPDLKDPYTGVKEFLAAFNWVMYAPPNLPAPYVESQEGAMMFSLNKVLRAAKDDKDQQRAFVKAMQAFLKEMYAFVKRFFKTGLEWNPRGVALADYKPKEGGAAAKPSPQAAAPAADVDEKTAEEPPKPAPKKKSGGGGGMAAVFASLKGAGMKGEKDSATDAFKLKRLKDEDRVCKNAALRKTGPVTATKKKKVVKKKAVAKKKKPAGMYERAGRWFVEYYTPADAPEGFISLPEDKMTIKKTVFITQCEGIGIIVPGKVKSVMVDGTKNVKVQINEVISTVELVGTKSTTLICQTKAPSIHVDKSQSARIILMPKAFAEKPDIVTSNVSAMNIEVPGATEDDDFIEIPVPEQFLTKIDLETKEATTTHVTHG